MHPDRNILFADVNGSVGVEGITALYGTPFVLI